jgi:hypothetical protein
VRAHAASLSTADSAARTVSTRRANSSIVDANAVTASSAGLTPSRDIRNGLAADVEPDARGHDIGRRIDDHLGPLATIFGVPDAERVDRLVDQDPHRAFAG